MKTVGISPKLYAATAAAIVAYLLTQQVLDLPPLAVLVLQAVAVALAAFTAPAGLVRSTAPVTLEGGGSHLAGEK